MLTTFLLSAFAACATIVSAEPASNAPAVALLERHGSLVDVDNFVDVYVLKTVIAPIVHKSGDGQLHKRLLNVNLDVDVSVHVHDLLSSALVTIEPVLAHIKETVEKVEDLAEEVVCETIEAALCTIEATLGTVVGDLAGLTGKVAKRSIFPSKKRAISNEEVAQVLANLLNGVAGAINIIEHTGESLPLLGPYTAIIHNKINGDLSLILSSVGTLLVGVVSLVKDLLSGVLAPVSGLPIVGALLGGLLGGLL